MSTSPTPSPPPAVIGLGGLTRPDGQEGQHPRIDAPPPPAPAAMPALSPLSPAEPAPVASTSSRPPRDAAGPAAIGHDAAARHPLAFTGSGSEYFRIWIVNLLLTLVTFGIYFPWAKVRRLRYFYGNTIVAGHPLDFHGDPWKMLRGYAIVAALFVTYSIASNYSPAAGGVALLVLGAIWPALLYAGLRFRLSQTSWRGLRFGFHGTIGGAYKALLPALLPAAILLPAFLLMEGRGRGEPPGTGAVIALGLVPLAIFAVVPLVWWSLKRYQHAGFGLGNLRATFTVGPWPFYTVFMKTSLLTLAAGVVFGIVAALLSGIGALVSSVMGSGNSRGVGAWMIVVLVILGVLGYAAVLWVSRPYFASRMQNLAWNHTESPEVGFDSRLRYRPLLWLSIKNWLLIILTLGLYWPFAAIATAKMKLEAIEVIARGDLDALARGEGEMSKDAAGDAAGDIFGIDIGM